MEYENFTVSFDASIKLKQGGLGGWLRHCARDVEERNGIHRRHSNPNIAPGETVENMTYVRDATGSLVPCTDTKQVHEALERRLGTVVLITS